jgi:YTH domain-containing family protein
MSTQESSNLPGSVPAAPASPTGTGVRRHHTISASSRTARGGARDTISEESSQSAELWDQDGVVEDDWVGGVGAVGEKSGLHRQTSLPTRYHRAQAIPPSGTRSGTRTPNRMNSLQAIAGHEENEQEWEKEIGGYNAGEDQVFYLFIHQHYL